MNQTSELKVATTEAAPKRGFPGLTCVRCGEADGCQLDLEDCDRITCVQCEAEYSLREDVAPLLAAWQRLLSWVALCPLAD